jgi:NitT/TauT family transport system permease protein
MTRQRAVAWTRAAVVVGAILAIELVCRLGIVSPLTLIPPSEMVASLWDLIVAGRVQDDLVQTFSTVAVAFALSVAFGCLAGAVIHRLPRVRRAVDPLLASYYSIPFFVFYPLLIAIFGLNTAPLIVIGFVFATAAMVIATLNGLDRVPRVLLKTARIHRLGRARSVFLVTLPAAAPHLFTGLKLALAYSFIGIIAGEFILSGGGLGYSIAYAYESFDNRTMYALMLFVLLIVTVMNMALHVWEQSFLRRRGGR